jgi:PiT family inorganic phosphate transporter
MSHAFLTRIPPGRAPVGPVRIRYGSEQVLVMDSSVFALALLVIVVVLVFDFSNGFNDAAPVVAAVISSGAMTPRIALLSAATFEFAGAYLLGTAVAKMIGTGIIDPRIVSPHVILVAVLAAIIWNFLAWFRGIPTSSSHALIGGLIGAAVAGSGLESAQWTNILTIYEVLILSPLITIAIAYVLTRGAFTILKQARPTTANRTFLQLQPWAAFALAMSHGSNDAQKGMGLITIALFMLYPIAPETIATFYEPGTDGQFMVPHWVILACSAAIALGMATGGWRIIRTLGGGLYRIRPIHGFTSQISAAAIIFASAEAGFPVSTSHIASSSIIGAGAAQRINAVRWSPVRQMLAAGGHHSVCRGINQEM